LSSSLIAQQVDVLRVALPLLVGSRCVSLATYLDSSRACLAGLNAGQSERGFQSVLEELRILLPSEELVTFCPPQDAYRFRLEQCRLFQERGDRILRCIGELVGQGSAIVLSKVQRQLRDLLSNGPMLSLMKRFIVADPEAFLKLGRAAAGPSYKSLLDTLLDPFNRLRE